MNDTQPLTDGASLSTLNESGTPPPSRIKDFTAAASIAERLRHANEARNAKGASIRGMFDGNPPFNPAELIKAGLRYYPNINTLEGKAYRSSALTPYYDLFSSAPHHAEIALDDPEDPQRERDASLVATEEFHRLLTEDAGSLWFELEMWQVLDDFVGFGKGFAVWPDQNSWRFRRVAWHRVLFPDKTSANPDTWDHFAVLWHYNAHELYRRVRNKERATAAGWNTDAVIKAIQSAAKYDPAQINDWIGIQQQLKDNDIDADGACGEIVTAWLFVKEFDGKWSWAIVPITSLMDPDGSKVSKELHGFLYRKLRAYDRVGQFLAPFYFEVGDGSLNGLSGLGKDILALMQLKDRMRCAQINNVFLRSALVLAPRSGVGRQKAALAQIGNVCILPEGYDVQQSTILGDIESTIAVGRDIDLMLQSNTGIYRPQFEKPQGNPETATAAMLRYQQGTVLTNSAVNRFYRQLDGLYAEMYRRLVASGDEDTRRFKVWCRERGVPEAALRKVRSVRAYRNVGNGSPFLRQSNANALLQMYPELPEDGKRNFQRDFVAAYTGQQKVRLYVDTDQAKGIPTRDLWEATQENEALKDGAPVTWYPGQDDNLHLAAHSQAAIQALASVQQGADPAAVALFGQAIVQHAQVHIMALERKGKGRKAQVKQWTNIYSDIASRVEDLMSMVQRNRQQQQMALQRQQQAMTDQQLDQWQAVKKLELQGMKTGHQMDLRERQAQQKMALADRTTVSKIVLDTAKAAADETRKSAEPSNGEA